MLGEIEKQNQQAMEEYKSQVKYITDLQVWLYHNTKYKIIVIYQLPFLLVLFKWQLKDLLLSKSIDQREATQLSMFVVGVS